jgi:hypothetical protein
VGHSEGKSADIEIVFGMRFQEATAAQLLCAANPTMYRAGKPQPGLVVKRTAPKQRR